MKRRNIKQVLGNVTWFLMGVSRKSQFTAQLPVRTQSGYEGPIDDGYSWIKYGQKCILGAKFPR